MITKSSRVTFAIIIAILIGSGCSNSVPVFRIYGDVSVDGGPPQFFEVPVGSSSAVITEIASNVFLAVGTPANNSDGSTKIEVMRFMAGEWKVIKKISSSDFSERSWSLAICGENISTASPARPVTCVSEAGNGAHRKT